MRIETRAHAKINWALNIIGRRTDGYHLLDMVMQSIKLADEMVFEEAETLTLYVDGRAATDPEQNLVMRAARALMVHTRIRRGATIHLKKNIPARAGLGGGSADCAATLRALNQLWGLNLDNEALLKIGATLGADVPFMLMGDMARVQGIGEILSPIPSAPEIPLVLVTPGGGLSTGEVFKLWDEGHYPPVKLNAQALIQAIVRKDLKAVDQLSANALTAPAIALMPEIERVMGRLRELGGRAVWMTGSGSTVVAAFDTPNHAHSAAEYLPKAVVTRTLGTS